MFNGMFNPENIVFRTCDRIFNLVLLSILWLALCLPIITIGPATAALYYTVVKCIRRREDSPFRNFFSSFKANFKVGVIVTIIVGAAGALLAYWYFVLLWLVGESGRDAQSFFYIAYVAYTVLLLLLIGVACYLFPVLSRFTSGTGQLFASAFQMAIRHLPTTLVLGFLNLELVLISVQLLYPIVFAPGIAVLLSSFLLERVFKKYMPPPPVSADLEEPEVPWYLK